MDQEQRKRVLERLRETERRDDRKLLEDIGAWMVIVVMLVYCAFALAECCSTASAQITRRTPDVEALARITVHEAGWEDTGDMEAIFAVLRSGAEREGTTWRAFARRYSRRLHAGTVERRWASQLTEECSRPSDWPETVIVRDGDSLTVRPHAPWGAFRERCEAVMVRAREVLAGERSDGCPVPPEDWGGRVDRARARRLGLVRIDCSLGDVRTVDDYYIRPRGPR